MVDNKRLIIIWLWVLIFAGITLRIWEFGSIPVDLNRDEAAIGYNAYSLLHFGKDEWGKNYPFLFESFGDGKLPGYIYALAPLTYFGTSNLIIRFPSLIAGMILIFLAYRIVWQVGKHKISSLVAAALTATAPWAIFYSRTAYEANVGLMWLVMTLVLIGETRIKWHLMLAAMTYVLAVITYNTPLLLLPGVVGFVLLLPTLTYKVKAYSSAIFIIIGIIIAALLFPVINQKQGITIFSDPTVMSVINNNYSQATDNFDRLINNKYLYWTKIIGTNFFHTISPLFLVFNGGSHPWHGIPNRGHVFILVYILGIYVLGSFLTNRKRFISQERSWWFIALIAVFPAIITVDAPHATRSLLFLYLIGVLAAIPWRKMQRLIQIGILVIVSLECLLYSYRYLVIFKHQQAPAWPVGISQAIKTALAESSEESRPIVMVSQDGNDLIGDQLYIYTLLQAQMDPMTYQNSVVYELRDPAHIIRVRRFSNFYISPIKIPENAVVISRENNGTYTVRN